MLRCVWRHKIIATVYIYFFHLFRSVIYFHRNADKTVYIYIDYNSVPNVNYMPWFARKSSLIITLKTIFVTIKLSYTAIFSITISHFTFPITWEFFFICNFANYGMWCVRIQCQYAFFAVYTSTKGYSYSCLFAQWRLQNIRLWQPVLAPFVLFILIKRLVGFKSCLIFLSFERQFPCSVDSFCIYLTNFWILTDLCTWAKRANL